MKKLATTWDDRDAILVATKDRSALVRRAAVKQLGKDYQSSLPERCFDRLYDMAHDSNEVLEIRQLALFVLCTEEKPRAGLADMLLNWLEDESPVKTASGTNGSIDLERGVSALSELARRDPRAATMLYHLGYSSNPSLSRLAQENRGFYHVDEKPFIQDVLDGRSLVHLGSDAAIRAAEDLVKLKEHEQRMAAYDREESARKYAQFLEDQKLMEELPKRIMAEKRIKERSSHLLGGESVPEGIAFEPLRKQQLERTLEGRLQLEREGRKSSRSIWSTTPEDLIQREIRQMEAESEDPFHKPGTRLLP